MVVLICRVISGAVEPLSSWLHGLPEELPADLHGAAAVHVLTACLRLSQFSSLASPAAVQLMQATVGWLASRGHTQLTAAASRVGSSSNEEAAAGGLRALLSVQLELAALCWHVPASAAAASEAVQPEQLAAWLAAAVHAWKALSVDSRTGGCIGPWGCCLHGAAAGRS